MSYLARGLELNLLQSCYFFKSLQMSVADPNNLMSLVTLMDLAIKRIIRMAMKITPFVRMCQEDQIALLKGGCTELMVLKSVLSYDPENNSWRVSL